MLNKTNSEFPIKGEIYSVERLEEYAAFLASELKIGNTPEQTLLPRMKDNGKVLLSSFRFFAEAVRQGDTLPPAAEWLTDNFHIVEEQLREISKDLPPKFYRELPKVLIGDLRGYPRVYAIALALVAHTDSRLEQNTIRRFIQAFQRISPLGIGELWALPITLRLVLVENLRRVATRVVQDHQRRHQANAFVDGLVEAVHQPARFKELLKNDPLTDGSVEEHAASIEQLAKRLVDQERELWPALEYIESKLLHWKVTIQDMVQFSHELQASNQVTVANVITSMRLLSGLNWKDFFESVSLVDRVLAQDAVYEKMDFATRDRYRHVIERISKRGKVPEIDVAQKAIQLGGGKVHVGEYLLGEGVSNLYAQFKARRRWSMAFFITSFPMSFYFGFLSFFTLILCAIPLNYIKDSSVATLIGCAALILIPCSELALALTNFSLTRLVPPEALPKLELVHGLPEDAYSMVIIPCMLSGQKTIEDLLEKIEIHYLGNADPRLYFALVTDFTDAQSENIPGDAEKVEFALDGLNRLNAKYASESDPRFFLFHRERQWNASEQAWIGWERKRGKIHELNKLLRGHDETSFVVVTAPTKLLPKIKYIITLDADTRLPRDTARKMIGTILHPLNQPQFDPKAGRVVKGYGILQPRVGITLESSNRSLFAKIFSGYTGVDPYTTAVSDVYQDLFQEGSFVGKGLYVIDAFEAALHEKVPENTVLSHDLFEGILSRAALQTDVEFLDDYPQSYHTFFTRLHRWVRGDWQIARWIFPFVGNAHGKIVRNSIPLISRWKIFDNLRRSLVAPISLLWAVLAFAILPGNPTFWLSYLLVLVLFPSLGFMLLSPGSLKNQLGVPGKVLVPLWQGLLSLIFLAHQAYVHTDAIARACYRQAISKKKRLEWATAAQTESLRKKAGLPFWQTPWPTQILLALLASSVVFAQPSMGVLALAILAVWATYPIVAEAVSLRETRSNEEIPSDDKRFLRQIARRTWNYFESFVGMESNWLPPDNYQEYPAPLTAFRTSPTNIGLYLMAISTAVDFGYLSVEGFLDRLTQTMDVLKRLEKHQGHYLNWYDIKTLQPLHPKYISTVDSGNLAAYFLTVRQSCLEVGLRAQDENAYFEGMKDSLDVLHSLFIEAKFSKGLLPLKTGNDILHSRSSEFSVWPQLANALAHVKLAVDEELRANSSGETESLRRFAKHVLEQAQQIEKEVAELFPWKNAKYKELSKANPEQWSHLQIELKVQAAEARERILLRAEALAKALDQELISMNFNFLLDQEREVFVIGYNLSDNRFDSGLYDLLASESRLASFVAIAKGDVPQKHWFRLGRQLVPIAGGRALISWTASMFEYLMPLLVMRDYQNTLLEETSRSVVRRQIKYGTENGVPWGISEAGYNARDLQMNYQYGPFGVPGLGLKRGLSQDLVISPYSTVLAAMVDPSAALQNMRRLVGEELLTPYGFYEAVDYTPERVPSNQKSVVIRSFMAHHQGMSFVAINNILNVNIMRERFHRDPRIRATQLLLQEKIPQNIIPTLPKTAEVEMQIERENTSSPLRRRYNNPNSSTPRIQLLSNRTYSVMISTAGAGYSKCGDATVSRWREDATRDSWGQFIFVRDIANKTLWSSTYQPLGQMPDQYNVIFGDDKVEFLRRDGDISTYTQIIVAPEDNVEIRHLTLTNHGDQDIVLELTSYLEPVLTRENSDLDHMAFSKLFIQTEILASRTALLAKRRKRSDNDKENWGLHVVVADVPIEKAVEYETNRENFIGRGKTLRNAQVLMEDFPLSNADGPTLDPILSLRLKIRVPAHGKAQVAFTTGMASTREHALELADRYHDIQSFERESKLAWTKSQVDTRHLNIDPETAYLYQRLAERILYHEPTLRTPSHKRTENLNVQSLLWACGISGDIPLLVVKLKKPDDMPNVRKLLRGHEYLRMKGLVYDFVIINQEHNTYSQNLNEEMMHQIRSMGLHASVNKPGGIFILRTDVTPEKTLAHIQAVARILLKADESLKDQMTRKSFEEKYPVEISFSKATPTPSPLMKLPQLTMDNGLGGFDKNGKEYVIILKGDQWTPAPWINVIGNDKDFGFQVSESGCGFTWSKNSQAHRLTPWSNDPVSDSPGEILYLRNDETGEVWTPTPLPIRSAAPYVVRHGFGYSTFEHNSHGLEHTLTMFVPKDDTVKVSLLKLKNVSDRKLKLTLTSYTEWVLGTQREKSAPQLLCDVDAPSGAIVARNPYDNEFADQIAFTAISAEDPSFTCSRKEFIGRNGNYASPAALKRAGLSGKTGASHDPCAVLQTTIELNPGQVFEASILLGESNDLKKIRELSASYRDLSFAKKSLNEVIEAWERLTQTIQVKTPDPAMDVLMNGWLLYQTLSCRFWSRTAFYQSGGAFGFRDQLQDSMAFVYSAPGIIREHILRAAARQFIEGDVQHWWHPPTGRGVRTRMTDDLLWLPYVVSFYIQATGDKSILNETVPYIEAPLLEVHQDDSYTFPKISSQFGTIFEHCMKAIDRANTSGSHGLPLMGTGDWNDGMNHVGFDGKGESVWLGWFLYKVLNDFADVCVDPQDLETKARLTARMLSLKEALEKNAWDGDWYRRAYYDDGSPLGSASSDECQIDSIAQSWAVLSGAGDRVRAEHAMAKVMEKLVREQSRLVLLFTPPFDKTAKNPGYIKGYVPGVRENGGQYTHASVWTMMALAGLGKTEDAYKIFALLNPLLRTQNLASARKYKIEPFVLAGDIYSGHHEGRGGWSWYTGSASWYYRAGLETLLGFQLHGASLTIDPCIPREWKNFEIAYRHGSSKYLIQIKNERLTNSKLVQIEVDGGEILGGSIPLQDDGKEYKVIVRLLDEKNAESLIRSYSDQSDL